MQNNPYDVLGVKETDSLAHINEVYKGFVKLLHPDKANTAEAKNLNMQPKEKLQYLQLIRKAYTTILQSRKETKYPDYKIEYEIDQESRINLHSGLTQDDAKNLDNNKFNKIFEESLERDKKAGIHDPFGRGYGEFNSGKDFSGNKPVVMPSYSPDIDVPTAKVFGRPNMKDDRLVEYIPDSSPFASAGLDYQELGLTNVSDFSVTTTGKGGLVGSDLMSVYGQNYEPWADTVKRDKVLSEKYFSETNVNERMARMESSRGDIYNLPVDHNMLEAERNRNFAMEQQERMRISSTKQRDEYYNELNKGRLNNGVPPR